MCSALLPPGVLGGLALGLTASLLGADLDAGCQHLLEPPLVAGLLLLLGFGEELAFLLQLLDLLLLPLFLDGLGLLAALLFLGNQTLLLLGQALGLGAGFGIVFFSSAELLLLLLDQGQMGGDLLLLASRLGGGRGNGRSDLLLLGGLDGLGSLCSRRRSRSLLLGGLGWWVVLEKRITCNVYKKI